MSDTPQSGFGKFIPGFDFLQNLAKSATQTVPQVPNMAHWVAPTLNVEDLEKRIEELRAVHFWLDQNSRAVAATIQALEVQKMTLATLQGMNFNMGDIAQALKAGGDAMMESVQKVGEAAAGTAEAMSQAAAGTAARATAARKKPTQAKRASSGNGGTGAAGATGATAAPAPLVDPMQWWGSLTQQFQQIASNAMRDAAAHSAADAASHKGTKDATASGTTRTAGSARATAPRASARKTARQGAKR